NGFTPGTGNFNNGFNPGFNNNFNNGFNNGPPRNMGPPGGRSSNQPPGGPGFFADRVKEDPDGSIFYDPRTDTDTVVQAPDSDGSLHLVRLVALRSEEAQAPPPQASTPPPAQGGTVVGPRSPVTAEALEELGVVVISGNNAADVQEVVRIIEMLQRLGA